jgi:hypothetical protein
MARWVLMLCLAVASTTAWGQSIQATTQAYNAAAAAERAVAQVTARRNALAQHWQGELRELDRVKNAPRSWRRDREVSAKLSETDALGTQLEAVNGELARATRALAVARGRLVAAIDAELALGPDAARRTRLLEARAQVVPRGTKARRIVLPDLQVDPLADPEELDQQAAALRETEAELGAQLEGLQVQHDALERIATLRKQHDRTHQLDRREDNTSRKNVSASAGNRGDTAEVSLDDAGPPAPESGGPGVGSFEMTASITLAEVVDPGTIDTLNRAGRSGDPKVRGEATLKLHDAVKQKLDQLRQARRRVEERARRLRGKT